MNYQFTKSNVSISQLSDQIRSSAITVALDYISYVGANLDIFFKAPLSTEEQQTLSALVDNHIAIPVIVEVTKVSVQESVPFAKPDYRTKHNATGTWVDCEASTSVNEDHTIVEERYLSGGEMIYTGVQKGDYFVAEVRDDNGLIPEAYRAALCENYPVVARYIEKKWLKPVGAGEFGSYRIDTYPLNAKLSPGLVLRVTLYTSSITGTRSFAMNYHKTKKL